VTQRTSKFAAREAVRATGHELPQQARIDRSEHSGKPSTRLDVVGLFAGIGGLEEGFRRSGHNSVMLCESDEAAQRVLRAQFPDVSIEKDIRALTRLPACDVITAGFPCQDLSQVGQRRGIEGPNSSLIGKVFELLHASKTPPTWLVLENVPFMLKLHKGRAIEAIVDALEKMGWTWAYRVVDTLSFGLPQRRRRVLLVASATADPRPVLLSTESTEKPKTQEARRLCGFYWTEGNTGLGWAEDAIPPLKGGSGLHIPSPPAIWIPDRRAICVPDIRDAERLQGFPSGWTKPANDDKHGERRRWRLVGNAVSVPVSKWLAGRLSTSEQYDCSTDAELTAGCPWPDAAWGKDGARRRADVSDRPVQTKRKHLDDFLRYPLRPLTWKATAGFLSRLERSSLNYDAAFCKDLRHHRDHEKSKKRRPRPGVGSHQKADGRNRKSKQPE
jgi:DNA (cytosine-5)-methyltransferase 1